MYKVIIGKPDFATVSVPNTGAILLAANPRRQVATIMNPTMVNLWVYFGRQNIVGEGFFVAGGGFAYEIDHNNLWRGSVYGIQASGSPIDINTYEGT